MSNPKKQHFVPQTYLKQWEDNENLIWLYNKEEKTVSHRNTNSFFYYLHLYSLTLFEFNYLTPQQQETFFKPLKPFSIYLDDKKLTLHDIMENIGKYDDFLIKKANGQIISRRQKEDLLEKVLTSKHFLIEEKYNNIESEWPDVVGFFENYRNMVIQEKVILPDANTFKAYIDKLLKFILSTYTRNPYNFVNILNRVEERHNFRLDEWRARTVFEKMQLLHLSDERHLFETEHYDIHLILTMPNTPFFTSDNPVIVKGIEMEDAEFTGIFWFPLSPNILVSLSNKQNQERIFINHYIVAEETVKKLNDIIYQYAKECFISCVNIGDNDYRFIKN